VEARRCENDSVHRQDVDLHGCHAIVVGLVGGHRLNW